MNETEKPVAKEQPSAPLSDGNEFQREQLEGDPKGTPSIGGKEFPDTFDGPYNPESK